MAPTDAVFEAVTDREALMRWAEAIRSDYPRAASIHNALLLHGRGLVDMYRFYALKDKPQDNVIMLKDKRTIAAEFASNKCKHFLATIIELAEDHKQPVAKHVRSLVQDLVDSKIEPEPFIEEVRRLLDSAPQPVLVPFLKARLPYLRHSLVRGEITIDGINPPPLNSTSLPGNTTALLGTNQTTIGLYCPVAHEAELLDALARTKLISWNQTVCFFYVPETLEPRLRSLVQDKIGVSGKLDSSLADLYTYYMENDSKKLLCPSGFTVKRLSPEATRQMFSIWKYSECTKTNHFLELCKKAPCAGVYRTPGEVSEQVLDITVTGLPEAGEDEKAVAWATSTYYGPIGLIGVDESLKKDDPEEKKQRKRLERLVVSACAHAMLREGFLVHCYQEEDEDVIRSMPGLTKDRPYTWLWRCDQMPPSGEQEHMETK